jgi:hypothetical protein
MISSMALASTEESVRKSCHASGWSAKAQAMGDAVPGGLIARNHQH